MASILRAGDEHVFARARRGVVLCTGGFVMNRDMVRRHAPWMLRSNFPIGTVDDGSGIRLGVSAGGAAINMAEGFVTLPWYPPGSLVKGIFVNERGQRFVNEDCYHGRVSQFILQQPGDRIWLLADAASYQPMEFQELSRVEIGAAGDTWQEVERELGLATGALVTTVELYNRNAARGEDPLFHKAARWLEPLTKPPFVALDCRIDHCFYSSFTLGGLDTLPTGEVLSEDRTVVSGLYAAGRTACGLPRWGAGYSSGMSLADATFFGRRAGLSVAQANGQEAPRVMSTPPDPWSDDDLLVIESSETAYGDMAPAPTDLQVRRRRMILWLVRRCAFPWIGSNLKASTKERHSRVRSSRTSRCTTCFWWRSFQLTGNRKSS